MPTLIDGEDRVETDGMHLWRQIGMTGSEHDECVLCGAVSAGLGVKADDKSRVPCERKIQLRRFGLGRIHMRVVR